MGCFKKGDRVCNTFLCYTLNILLFQLNLLILLKFYNYEGINRKHR